MLYSRSTAPTRLAAVSELSKMKDHQRLNLLKEVAGTQVYEERRKESMGILQGTPRSTPPGRCFTVS